MSLWFLNVEARGKTTFYTETLFMISLFFYHFCLFFVKYFLFNLVNILAQIVAILANLVRLTFLLRWCLVSEIEKKNPASITDYVISDYLIMWTE